MIDETDPELELGDIADLPPAEQETVAADDLETERRRRTRIKREYDEAVAFWSHALSTEVGRREIWRLLESAHTFEDRFACGPNGFPQVEATWFQAGEKAFGQRLWLTLQKYDITGVLRMHSELDPRLAKPNVPRRKVKNG
jgi:hypothetical protein